MAFLTGRRAQCMSRSACSSSNEILSGTHDHIGRQRLHYINESRCQHYNNSPNSHRLLFSPFRVTPCNALYLAPLYLVGLGGLGRYSPGPHTKGLPKDATHASKRCKKYIGEAPDNGCNLLLVRIISIIAHIRLTDRKSVV